MFLNLNLYKKASGTFLNLTYFFKNDDFKVFLAVRNFIWGPPLKYSESCRAATSGGGAVLPGPEIVFRPVYNCKIRNIFSKFSLSLFFTFDKIQL